MNRKPWEELLFLYLTGTLSPEDRADFEQFVSENEVYRAELNEWRELAEAVRTEADARVDQLPALTLAFYQRLQNQIKPSLNGSHSTHPKERKIMNITQIQASEPRETPRSPRSITLAAALLAVIAFASVLLFANRQRPDGDSFLSGVHLQSGTATLIFTPTSVSEAATQAALEPVYLTATAMVRDATQFAAESARPLPTFTLTFTPTPVPFSLTSLPSTVEPPVGADGVATPSPVPFYIESITATPIPWNADPTMPPPIMSITPSQITPIVSFPARVIQDIQLPTGDASRAIAWSPDVETIAVAGYQGTWMLNADHISGAARLFADNGPGVLEVAFSADSSLLATLNAEQTLRIWDVEAGIQLAEMWQSPLWDDLQFSANGQYLISKNSDQKINLAGLSEGILEAESLTSADLNGYYALLSPDGETLAAYNNDGSVLLLNSETAEASGNFDWPSNFIRQAAYSKDGQQLALGGDKEVVVVDAAGGDYQNSMSTLGMVTGLSFNSDGTMLAASMRSDKIQSLWLMNMIPGNTFYTAIFVYDLPLVNPVFSPTGNQLAVGTEDGRLFILEITQ